MSESRHVIGAVCVAARAAQNKNSKEGRMWHSVVKALALGGGAVAIFFGTAAAEWPDAPVRVVVPFAAGGAPRKPARSL